MKRINFDGKSALNLNTSLLLPEMKRVKSVRQMVQTFRQQQLTIKSALGNLDKKSTNKIVFEEDAGVLKFDEFNNTKSEQSGKKKSFFHSDDEEDSCNFKVKNNFLGKEGQQLFELHSKFKDDGRFEVDQRFIENNTESTAVCTELSMKEEKENEIDILQKILGTKIKSDNQQENSIGRHVLRFDPTQCNHQKYEVKLQNTKMKMKKGIKQNNENQSNVSKDMFYKVREDLMYTFQSQQEFSLLNTFSKRDQKQIEEQPIVIENIQKSYLETNIFQYDSTEDELEPFQENTQSNNAYQPEVNFLPDSLFFKHEDFRLQEGSDFIRRVASGNNSAFVAQRRSLKHIVKTKVSNSKRKNKTFKNKLGGNKKKKIFRTRKALNR